MIDAIQALNATKLANAVEESQATTAINGTVSAQMNPTDQAAMAGESFADFMSQLSTKFVDNIKGAETKSIDGIMGKASVREVVESVMAADQTLQTAMAFRDKIVSAYLEIVKMPI